MPRPDLYPTIAPEKSYAPEKWTARHRFICQLHAIGWNNNEIASMVDLTPSRVSIILSDPRAQLDIDSAVESVADNIVDLHTRIKAHAVEALDDLVHTMRHSTDEKLRTKVDFGLLDRAGYTPVQKHMTVTPELPADMADRVEQAIESTRPVDGAEEVEYEIVDVSHQELEEDDAA